MPRNQTEDQDAKIILAETLARTNRVEELREESIRQTEGMRCRKCGHPDSPCPVCKKGSTGTVTGNYGHEFGTCNRCGKPLTPLGQKCPDRKCRREFVRDRQRKKFKLTGKSSTPDP